MPESPTPSKEGKEGLLTVHTNFHKLRTIPSTKSWVRVLVVVVVVVVVTGGKVKSTPSFGLGWEFDNMVKGGSSQLRSLHESVQNNSAPTPILQIVQ